MRITIDIHTDNAAWEDARGREVERISRMLLVPYLLTYTHSEERHRSIMDTNGNTFAVLRADLSAVADLSDGA